MMMHVQRITPIVKLNFKIPCYNTFKCRNRSKHKRQKNIIIKNCGPFTDCKSGINNTQIDNAKDIDIVMSMYNLIEYSGNYSKTSRWQYY